MAWPAMVRPGKRHVASPTPHRSRVIWPIVGLLSIPAGVVAAAVLLEGRIVDAEFAEKLE